MSQETEENEEKPNDMKAKIEKLKAQKQKAEKNGNTRLAETLEQKIKAIETKQVILK